MSIVIGDLAGQYDALIRLVAKLPPDQDIILVGDLVDRGPKSREVIEWAMKTPNVRALRGNHEDMLLDFVRDSGRYDQGLYFQNGGGATLTSYGFLNYPTPEEAQAKIPAEHLRWLRRLPLYIEEGIYFISHAPIFFDRTVEQAKEYAKNELDPTNRVSPAGLMWNRYEPVDQKGVIQVFGHNANWGLKWFENDGTKYALCLDDSWQEKVTGFDTNTLEIYQEPYKETA